MDWFVFPSVLWVPSACFHTASAVSCHVFFIFTRISAGWKMVSWCSSALGFALIETDHIVKSYTKLSHRPELACTHLFAALFIRFGVFRCSAFECCGYFACVLFQLLSPNLFCLFVSFLYSWLLLPWPCLSLFAFITGILWVSCNLVFVPLRVLPFSCSFPEII